MRAPLVGNTTLSSCPLNKVSRIGSALKSCRYSKMMEPVLYPQLSLVGGGLTCTAPLVPMGFKAFPQFDFVASKADLRWDPQVKNADWYSLRILRAEKRRRSAPLEGSRKSLLSVVVVECFQHRWTLGLRWSIHSVLRMNWYSGGR